MNPPGAAGGAAVPSEACKGVYSIYYKLEW
jgi:hypothetical protein